MAESQNSESSLAAKKIAAIILFKRGSINKLLAKWGVDSTNLSAMDTLKKVEYLTQRHEEFASDLFKMISDFDANANNFRNLSGESRYRYTVCPDNPPFPIGCTQKMGGQAAPFDFGGLFGTIFSGASGVLGSVGGIIDATSDSGKKVRETQAQAALIEAQAKLEAAKQAQNITKGLAKPFPWITVSIITGVTAIAITSVILIVRYKKKSKK